MSTVELKNKVLEKLESVEEAYLLEEILGLLEIESKAEIVKIPEHYKDKLDKSISQKRLGDTIPNKIVEESIEEWLYK